MTFLGPINYIFKSTDIVKKLIILIVFSIFVISSPAVIGYGIKSIRAVRDGNDELPDLEFGDFVDLFIDGLRLSVQMLLLVMPMLLVSIISLVSIVSGKGAIFGFAAVLLIVGVLNLLALIYYGMAITCLAVEDNGWLLVFKFSELNKIISAQRGKYFCAVVFSIAWNFVFSIAASFIPFIGSFIVSPFTMAAQAYFSGMYMREIGGPQNLAPVAKVYDASDDNSQDTNSSSEPAADLGDNSDY